MDVLKGKGGPAEVHSAHAVLHEDVARQWTRLNEYDGPMRSTPRSDTSLDPADLTRLGVNQGDGLPSFPGVARFLTQDGHQPVSIKTQLSLCIWDWHRARPCRIKDGNGSREVTV